MQEAEQQILDLHGPVTPTFDNYIAGPNEMLVAMLRQLAVKPEGWHYFSGAPCSGKTHLLLAAMHAAEQSGAAARYLALGSDTVSAGLINQLYPPELLLLDDVDSLKHSAECQEAIFHCLNRMHQQGATLIVSSGLPAHKLELPLPDLKSRLTKCQQHKLKPLTDDHIPELVKTYFNAYQLAVDQRVVNYLIRHGPRNSARRIKVLREVARRALQMKRRITVQLVMGVLQDLGLSDGGQSPQ